MSETISICERKTTIKTVVQRAAIIADIYDNGNVFLVPINGGHAIATAVPVIRLPYRFRLMDGNSVPFNTLENIWLL